MHRIIAQALWLTVVVLTAWGADLMARRGSSTPAPLEHEVLRGSTKNPSGQ